MSCPVCSKQYNDNLRLPLTTSCGHTTCTTCLRSHTLTSYPDAKPGREGQVPLGKIIECQQCQKSVNTDDLVINRAVLAKVPLSLEDLIISYSPGAATDDNQQPDDPQPSTTPTDTYTEPHSPQEHKAVDLSLPLPQQDPSQVPVGWSIPQQPVEMDPYHPQHPHHPPTQPGVVGWTGAPGHPPHPTHPPHQMPFPPHGYPGHPQHHHHPQHHPSHHPHGHSHTPALVAGAGGLAAGAAAGAGLHALSTSHKKKKKSKDKKHKKKGKERRHRSSSSSSSGSGSSGSGSSSGSSSD